MILNISLQYALHKEKNLLLELIKLFKMKNS